MKKLCLSSVIISATLLSACSSPERAAPVVEHSQTRHTETVTPIVSPTRPIASRPVESSGNYVVKKGDTLYRIALDFGQNYRDLVMWNNLANPNDIKVDQVLRVAPPEATEGSVTVGVVTPPTNDVSVTPVVAQTPPNSAAYANKSSPRGEKKAYSEQVLAEMQKPEAIASPVALPPGKPELAKPVEPRQAEKNVEPAAVPLVPAKDEESSATVSFIWPTEGKMVSGFDEGKKGIDLAGKAGQAVLSSSAGKVVYVGSGIRGYGNLVIVKHSSSLLSAYAHNKTILVKEGQDVARGQKIAEMGDTDSDSVKLHFEIRQQGKPVDPLKFLPPTK